MTAHVEKDQYFPGEVANVLLQVSHDLPHVHARRLPPDDTLHLCVWRVRALCVPRGAR